MKRPRKQTMLESTQELLAPEHTVRHTAHATRKVMMKDAKSLMLKKTLDEESIKLRDMARKYIQKNELEEEEPSGIIEKEEGRAVKAQRSKRSARLTDNTG